MEAFLRNVEKQLANILPNSFGIVIDGLTESGTHLLAIYIYGVGQYGAKSMHC